VLINSKSVLNPRDDACKKGFMSGEALSVFPTLFLFSLRGITKYVPDPHDKIRKKTVSCGGAPQRRFEI
jgi:hypothetical protein